MQRKARASIALCTYVYIWQGYMQQEMQRQEEMTNHALQPAHMQDLLSDTGIETRLAAGSWGNDWQQDEVGVCAAQPLRWKWSSQAPGDLFHCGLTPNSQAGHIEQKENTRINLPKFVNKHRRLQTSAVGCRSATYLCRIYLWDFQFRIKCCLKLELLTQGLLPPSPSRLSALLPVLLPSKFSFSQGHKDFPFYFQPVRFKDLFHLSVLLVWVEYKVMIQLSGQ